MKSAGVTVTETVREWDFVPPEEGIVTWQAPIGAPCNAVTLRVVSILAPDEGVRMLLASRARIHPFPACDTVVVSPVAMSKPLRLATVTVAVAVEPWLMVSAGGAEDRVKSL